MNKIANAGKEENYAASRAIPEFPVLWVGSVQSLTFFIELHVCCNNLSNDVNFIREKSSLQAGTGERTDTDLAFESDLNNN